MPSAKVIEKTIKTGITLELSLEEAVALSILTGCVSQSGIGKYTNYVFRALEPFLLCKNKDSCDYSEYDNHYDFSGGEGIIRFKNISEDHIKNIWKFK